MNPRFCGISGPVQGATFLVDSEELSIGRDPSNHIWASDPALSRKHCALTMDDGSHAYGKETLKGMFARLLRGLPKGPSKPRPGVSTPWSQPDSNRRNHLTSGRPDSNRRNLSAPNRALYQAELRPGGP